MIARTQSRLQPEGWQRELAEGFRLPSELLAALGLDPALPGVDLAADNPFPQRVPVSYVRRMRYGDPADPLLRQVLPLLAEREPPPPGFLRDPVGDLAAERAPGVLRKYRGRALLITTGACAIHCRYCFRRHYPYGDAMRAEDEWQAALEAIAGGEDLTEVILSGGDPLSLANHRLAALVERLEALPRLRRLRLHTRLPVVLPSRVDDALIRLLADTRLKPVVVIHANHPAEIDEEVRGALARLAAAGAILLNQSVLLRGVNDDAGVLAELSEALFEAGVTPYYLHMLDRVAGAAHFEVEQERAREIHAQLRGRLPGYLVPRLVREEPGADAKTPVI
jgi:EF-P beta-lysylation protein EpmB